MPYEVEHIAEVPDSTSAKPAIEFRPERVIDPYRGRALPEHVGSSNRPQLGQSDLSKASPTGPGTDAPEPKTEETVNLSPAAAALARKEQKYRRDEQALKDREKAIEAKSQKLARLEELEAKLAKNDYSGVEELIKYDEYTNYLIDKQASNDPTMQELKKLGQKVSEVEEARKKDEDKLFQAVVSDRRRVVKDLVAKDDAYSSIREFKYEEHVVQHILDTWESDGVELTPEQAAKEVEEILVETAKKWTSLPKLRSEVPAPTVKNLPPLKPQLKTLSNNVTPAEPVRQPRSYQNMSDEQRWAEARRRAEERLKRGM